MKNMKTETNMIRSLTYILIILQVISMLNINAQDYQISFAGSGESTTVDSVFIENLTRGTTLEMKGTDVLHLKGTVPVFETTSNYETGKVTFYPNPMKEVTTFSFALTSSAGKVSLEIFTLSGRRIKSIEKNSVPADYNEFCSWDGRDADGDRVATGVYIYKLTAVPENSGKAVESFGKVVVVN